jgi:ComEC/Rec2-related protein
MGMRLFFCIFSFFFSLLLCFSQDTIYIPVKFSPAISGEAILTQDISKTEKKIGLNVFTMKTSHVESGCVWNNTFYLPQASKYDHYRGEVIYCLFHSSNRGKISLEHIEYTGKYEKTSQIIRAQFLKSVRKKMEHLGIPGGLLESLILGKKDRLTNEDTLFRNAGVSHLLALSGLHRGIITLLLLLLLRPFVPKNVLIPIIIILLCGYTWLIGTKHSLLRAVIMYFFLMTADLCKFKPSLLKILIVSLILQIIIWPESVNSLSLQLSYLAMVGIIFLANPFNYFLKRFIPGFLAIPLSLSLGAQLALFPLLINVFGVVQLWGILGGIILTPLITLFIWTGMISLPFLYLIPPLNGLVKLILNSQYRIIIGVVTLFSKMRPVRIEEQSSRLLIFLSLSVMLIRIILLLIKEGYLVRKSFKTEL